MKKFEVLSHTADLKIRVFGRTKKELFKNAMLGMQQVLRPEPKRQRTEAKKRINIQSNNLVSLLVDFLSEVNYLNETNYETYHNVKFFDLSNNCLEGEISGEKVERFGSIIKGITYHNLDIKKNKDGFWEAVILFDI